MLYSLLYHGRRISLFFFYKIICYNIINNSNKEQRVIMKLQILVP